MTITAGDSQQTDWARVGRGFQATTRTPLHFGLGTEATVDAVSVVYAGGTRQTFEGPFDARQSLIIRR